MCLMRHIFACNLILVFHIYCLNSVLWNLLNSFGDDIASYKSLMIERPSLSLSFVNYPFLIASAACRCMINRPLLLRLIVT